MWLDLYLFQSSKSAGVKRHKSVVIPRMGITELAIETRDLVKLSSVIRHGDVYLSFSNEGGTPVHNVWAASVYLEVFGGVLAFVAWLMGGTGIGRDIGEGSGAFMLTRPRPRRYFVWWDIGTCLCLLILLGCVTMALFEMGVHFHVLRFGGMLHG